MSTPSPPQMCIRDSLKDIYSLKKGDIINMNKPKDSDVDIFVGNKLWFKGKPGLYNKNIAVKINALSKN